MKIFRNIVAIAGLVILVTTCNLVTKVIVAEQAYDLNHQS